MNLKLLVRDFKFENDMNVKLQNYSAKQAAIFTKVNLMQ